MRACVHALALAACLATLAQASAMNRTATCICVDSFSHFMANASAAYKEDVAHRLAAELDVGETARRAVQHIWDNLAPTAATDSSYHRRQTQLNICEVCSRPTPRSTAQPGIPRSSGAMPVEVLHHAAHKSERAPLASHELVLDVSSHNVTHACRSFTQACAMARHPHAPTAAYPS